jgi:ATP-dependent Clp protease ATP-binding subunit ClpC
MNPDDAHHLELRTLVFVRELDNGSCLAHPLAEPEAVAYADGQAEALAELQAYLEEKLVKEEPGVLARHAFPEQTELHLLDVELPRPGLPRVQQLPHPVTLACVVIPHGRDRWVVVPALDHTFHLDAREDLEQEAAREIQRLVAALQPEPLELSTLLPCYGQRLVPLDLRLDRSLERLPGKARGLRRAQALKRQRKEAEELLRAVGTPLHDDPARWRGPGLVAREPELEQLSKLLGAEQRLSLVLVAPDLVGKSALWRKWLQHNARAAEPRPAYACSAAQLLAGMSGFGEWQQRVGQALEAAEALDAVLYFDDLGELFSDHPGSTVDLAGALRPFLDEERVRLVGELRPELLDRLQDRHAGFFAALHRLKLEPLSAEQTFEALRARVEHEAIVAPNRPVLRKDAAEALLDLVERYLPYQPYPGKALALYEELLAVHDQPDQPHQISADQVFETFAVQTGVPVFLLRQDRALKLSQVLASLEEQVKGQEQALRLVAETLCVVKASLQPPGKPLASLLFVGPTGVGKTEVARCLARYLFGSQQRLLRFDMSEFADLLAAERLIRGTDRDEGLLTRRVRQQPFGVLLLDEIEKAHPAVFDLLLQVLGEGRLTDAAGRTAHFDNTLIIMTSNLGVAHRRAPIGLDHGAPPDDSAYYMEQVERAFRPELVNRLDRVVPFHPLTPEQLRQIAGLQLEALAERRGLATAGLELEVSEAAQSWLAERGHSPQYGARQLRRQLEDNLVTPVARMLSAAGPGGHRLQVGLAAEEPAGGEAEQGVLARQDAGPLRLRLLSGGSQRPAAGSRGLAQVSEARRRIEQLLEWSEVKEVKERILYLVAQLAEPVGRRQRRKRKLMAPEQLAQMQAEHHRLQAVWEQAENTRQELVAAEDLALAALQTREPTELYQQESRRLRRQGLALIFQLLVALHENRDRATLMVQELDRGRALDHWLLPLLPGLQQRGWTLRAHADGDRADRGEQWPDDRRWGPPRDAPWLERWLQQEQRPPASLVLRFSGPLAGIELGLESGLHDYRGLGGRAGEPTRLLVHLLCLRSGLTPGEWKHEALTPAKPAELSELRRMPASRRYARPDGYCLLLDGELELPVPLDAYWPRHQELLAGELLAWLTVGEEIDDLLPERLPPVPR